MPSTDPHSPIIGDGPAYDAVVIGASLAGCATAIQLGRAGLSVALIEKQPDPQAFKRVCSHFIQASAVPTLERLGLLEPMEAAGAQRPRIHTWSRWGWVEAPPDRSPRGVNLRREVLDPLVRETAAATPGVEMLLGWTAERLLRDDSGFSGVVVRDREGEERKVRGRLTIGADGRDSKTAELAEVPVKTYPNNRIAYGGYFEGPPPRHYPDSTIWFLDPHWAASFPTDSGLQFYAAMPTKERLPEFKENPTEALVRFVGDIPEAPPIRESRLVQPVIGKLDMTNRKRRLTAPGLALVGDAGMATDPLFGVGCGWAFQSSEWLAESVVPALRGSEPLERGLKRYRHRHARELGGHLFFIHNYATGRRMNPAERLMFSAAALDPKVAELFEAFGTRVMKPQQMLPRILPRALAVHTRQALAR
jgi:2-polyprenyl-6-methoxyphenol hydroxylase-like FAD-dependent oxidoreductase